MNRALFVPPTRRILRSTCLYTLSGLVVTMIFGLVGFTLQMRATVALPARVDTPSASGPLAEVVNAWQTQSQMSVFVIRSQQFATSQRWYVPTNEGVTVGIDTFGSTAVIDLESDWRRNVDAQSIIDHRVLVSSIAYVSVGWPFQFLHGLLGIDPSLQPPMRRAGVITLHDPYHPTRLLILPIYCIWSGAFLNVLVWGMATMLVHRGLITVRSSYRRTIQRCVKCNYDLRGSITTDKCPECGRKVIIPGR